MSKTPWKKWHEVVALRDDLRSGELEMNQFAADLYDVVLGKAKPVYQTPGDFFALTYPTLALRNLARDVMMRLAGKSTKAIRQLELTYGGGKTHTLITLYHLVNDPAALPDLPAVNEFREHAGIDPPKARVAVLPGDKMDVETGLEVFSPTGEKKKLKEPWSMLAFQLAGEEGLKILNDGKTKERQSPPAEPLLEALLRFPAQDGLATLVLIDEFLMYARSKVGLDAAWGGRLQDFFQALTQASVKVDTCAVVASLLATDPSKSDEVGRGIIKDLYDIFQREREEIVHPVGKEDVAEVLRRRFFKPDSIRDREAFRPHVAAAFKGIEDLDDQSKKERGSLEEKFFDSYPFHPGLTDIFYSKWATGMSSFQRTRGILRTFAMALRDAEKWDTSPLVGPGIFLNEPAKKDLSQAATELAKIATQEEVEGRLEDWDGILVHELERAAEIQNDFPGLKHREVETAVMATFLHSQPKGKKATTPELYSLVGPTRPDRIALNEGLKAWADASWYLDEEDLYDAADGGTVTFAEPKVVDFPYKAGVNSRYGHRSVPKTWRLGSKPNLNHMHHDACEKISWDAVEINLLQEISRTKTLTAGASAAGAKVHTLPEHPKDIEDDGEFHYAVLGPKAACDSGKPSAEAKKFLEQTTSADRPRVNKNALVMVAPSRDGLEGARQAVRDYLGWQEVAHKLRASDLDPIRGSVLNNNQRVAKNRVAIMIQEAYFVVVSYGEDGQVNAFRVKREQENLFASIKADSRSRIQETVVDPEALLPGGPYNLWHEGETSRPMKDIVGAFAQHPHLPKMLGRKAIVDTMVRGCEEGLLVLRLTLPDKSVSTWWKSVPGPEVLKDAALEVVIPEAAELTSLPVHILHASTFPGLWEKGAVTFGQLESWFDGAHTQEVNRGGYSQAFPIPKATHEALKQGVGQAVQEGKLTLCSGPVCLLGEEIPPGFLDADARLEPPPSPISPTELLEENLPEAWREGAASALHLFNLLGKKHGRALPWTVVQRAMDEAIKYRYLERTEDSGAWPCDLGAAKDVRFAVPTGGPVIQEPQTSSSSHGNGATASATLDAAGIQDLADVVADLVREAEAMAGMKLTIQVRLELEGDQNPEPQLLEKLNAILKDIRAGLEFI